MREKNGEKEEDTRRVKKGKTCYGKSEKEKRRKRRSEERGKIRD